MESEEETRKKNKGSKGGKGDGYRPNVEEHKCTDFICTVIFFLFWVGMLWIAVVGFIYGDALRLIFGTDYLGNTCGPSSSCGGEKCGKQIYYPRQGLDSVSQSSGGGVSVNDIDLFGICVSECPSTGDFICTYEVEEQLRNTYPDSEDRSEFLQNCSMYMHENNLGLLNNFGLDALLASNCYQYMKNCWFVVEDQDPFFFRCVPQKTMVTKTSEYCYFPEYQDASEETRMPSLFCEDERQQSILPEQCDNDVCKNRTNRGCITNDRCMYSLSTRTVESIESSFTSTNSVLVERLSTWTMSFQRHLADVKQSWYTILITGIVGAVVLGLFWLKVLQYCVGVFVWTILTVTLILQLLFTLLCFAKAGKLNNEVNWLLDTAGLWRNQSSELDGEGLEVTEKILSASSNEGLWNALGITMAVITVIYFIIILVMGKRIRLAIAILKEASLAIQKLKFVLLFPLWTCTWTLILFAYSGTVFGYLFTAGSIERHELSLSKIQNGLIESVQTYRQGGRRLDLDVGSSISDAGDVVVNSITSNPYIRQMCMYHFFGYLWTQQVINAVSITTLSGAVCSWYWMNQDEKSSHFKIPLFASFKRTILRHFGTMCFGAFLIAIIQFLRTLIYYLDKRTKRIQQENHVIKVLLRALKCCVWCFEKLLKYVTRQAYIMTAMCGYPFCKATREAVRLLQNNIARISTVNFISAFVINLSKVVIITSCALLEWVWLKNDKQFAQGGDKEISSEAVTLVITAFCSFWMANVFMHVYSVTVDTILLCFCVDVEKNRDSKQYFMGKSLKRFFASQKKGRRSQKPSSSPAVVPASKPDT